MVQKVTGNEVEGLPMSQLHLQYGQARGNAAQWGETLGMDWSGWVYSGCCTFMQLPCRADGDAKQAHLQCYNSPEYGDTPSRRHI